MITPSAEQTAAAFRAVRHAIDSSGYGRWVSDDICTSTAMTVAIAVLNAPAPADQTKKAS